MVNRIINKIKDFFAHILSSRILILGAIMCALFIVLMVRLFVLQIVKGSEYSENYNQLTVTTVNTEATRGTIYDCNGVPLAYNEVKYAVTITDNGSYDSGYDWNEMLEELVPLLDSHGETIVSSFPMAYDTNGDIQFTTASQSEKNTLLMNIYGVSSTDAFDQTTSSGKTLYPSDPTPEEFLEYAMKRFGVGYNSDESSRNLDKDTALKILNIRYSMYLVSYISYQDVTVASDVSQATVTDILEHADSLVDVTITDEIVRTYANAECFSNILGYIGVASDEELAELQAEDSSYSTGDVVGKSGIEQVMEQELSGTKGTTTMMVDSRGRIMETIEQTDAQAGNDVYLTIDSELQVAVYYKLEQSLASIILAHLVNDEVDPTTYDDTAQIPISIYDVYFQMINNNILSISDFSADDASDVEKSMYSMYTSELSNDLGKISNYMTKSAPVNESEDMRDLLDYCIEYMDDSGYISYSNTDQYYKDWYNGTINFYSYIEHLISEGDVDLSSLGLEASYTDTAETISALRDALLNEMPDDTGFAKLVYEDLIHARSITGAQICLALFYQGVLEWDDTAVAGLYSGATDAYSFMSSKIESMEISPAMIALDPCTASCVILDTDTHVPLAIVSYPGYDLNEMSGSINASYYSQLLNDQSNPLYNNATQTRTAPGSTFKPITATAALETGIITANSQINTLGIFTEAGMNLRCWYYPNSHGLINVRQAIEVSCNYFFCELGYRMSFTSDGNYNEAQGLNTLATYAKMFGLGEKTGIEIPENDPEISDTSSIASSIGQGTHAYTCISLARYAMTMADYGELYKLTLLSKVTDYEGNVLESYEPELESTADISRSTFDTVRGGMNGVVSGSGSCASIFESCVVSSAGKTGTAEQSDVRGPHGLFIGFAPYEDPQISYCVMIPFGYSSGYAATTARDIVNYYFSEDSSLDDVINGNASSSISGNHVAD